MPFTTDTFARTAFKVLQSTANTGASKELADEAEESNPSMAASDIFGEILPSNPATAITNGFAAFVTLNVGLDPASNGKAYLATINTVAGTGLDTKINPKTGLAYQNGDRVGFAIPPSFGPAYRSTLYNNGVEVPPLSFENWFFDYRAGIVTSELDLGLINGTIDCYVYIGRLLSDRLNDLDVSDADWTISGNDVYNANSGNVGINTTTPSEQLEVVGGIKLGSTSTSNVGTIRWNQLNLQRFDGLQWRNLDDDLAAVSITTLTDSSLVLGATNPFKASTFPTFVENTNWLHNFSGGNISYRPVDGVFIVSKTGAYELNLITSLSASSSAGVISLSFSVNGTIVRTLDADINGGIDPIEASFMIIQELNVNDVIEVVVNSSVLPISIIKGTSFSTHIVSADHSSTSLLTNGASSALEINPFNEVDNGGAANFVQGIDWDHNAIPQNIRFTQNNGEFHFSKSGVYKIVANIVLLTVSSSQSVIVRLKKNGVIFYSTTIFITTFNDPVEKSIILVEDFTGGDILTLTVDGQTSNIVPSLGTTVSIYSVGQEQVSATILSDSLPTIPQYNIFQASNYAAFVQNVDWAYNAAPLDIIYSSNGTFSPTRSGIYKVEAVLSLTTSSSFLVTLGITVKKNGTSIYFQDSLISGSTDPIERTVSFIAGFNSGDLISFLVAGDGVSSITTNVGTSVSITNVTPEDSQPSFWVREIGTSNIQFLGGNIGIGDALSSATESLHIRNTKSAALKIESNSGGGSAGIARAYLELNDNDSESSLLGLNQSTGIGPDGSIIADAIANSLVLRAGGPTNLNSMQFATNNAVRITIDDNGKVGIGKTPSAHELAIGDLAGADLVLNRNDLNILPGEILGRLLFRGDQSSADGARIWAQALGTWGGGNSASTVMKFSANDGGTGDLSPNERMTISGDGIVIGDNTGPSFPDAGAFNGPTLHVHKSSAGLATALGDSIIIAESSTNGYLQLLSPATQQNGILFGSPISAVRGGIIYLHSTDTMQFRNTGDVTYGEFTAGQFRVLSQIDAGIVIDADTNDLGGQAENPYLRMTQKGIKTGFHMSINGVINQDYEGASVTDALRNYGMIHTKDGPGAPAFARGIQFATGNSGLNTAEVVMTLLHDTHRMGVGTVTPGAKLEVDNKITGDNILMLSDNSVSKITVPAGMNTPVTGSQLVSTDTLGALEWDIPGAPSRGISFYDDFLTYNANTNWLLTSGFGGSVSATSTGVDNNHAGVITLKTGVTGSNSYAMLSSNQTSLRLSGGTTTFEAAVYIPILSVKNGEEYGFRIGIGDDTSGSGSFGNGVYFEYDTFALSLASGSHWRCKTSAGSTSTNLDSGVTVTAGLWTHLKIVVIGISSATFYINGIFVATTALTLFNGTSGLSIQLRKTGGALSLLREVLVDYYAYHKSVNRNPV